MADTQRSRSKQAPVPGGSRRERQRAATVTEIKQAARALMGEEGPAALSLAAVARRIGLSQPGMYRYYASRDELITELVADGYDSLARALQAAGENGPSDLASRLLAVGVAYRAWAVDHLGEFGLIFGTPIPGYEAPPGGSTTGAAGRAFAPMLRVFNAIVVQGGPSPRHAGGLTPALTDQLGSALDRITIFDTAAWSPEVLQAHLGAWGRMHGLITLEVFGHLRAMVTDAADLYRAEMLALIEDLGLPPPAASAP